MPFVHFLHLLCSVDILLDSVYVGIVCGHFLFEFGGALTYCCFCAGQILWRRLLRLPPPSHHGIRTACMQILPAVERYCRAELQEDCGDLHQLMLRFDDEAELQSHELGRSLLHMVRDEDDGLGSLSRRIHIDAPQNPFDVVRARIAAVDLAFRGLRPQLQVVPGFNVACKRAGNLLIRIWLPFHLANCASHIAQFVCSAVHSPPLQFYMRLRGQATGMCFQFA